MYDKLEKIRRELECAKQRRVEADVRVKSLEQKLKEAESLQILADVSALRLTPEQVAQFLKLAAAGNLPINNGTLNQSFLGSKTEVVSADEHIETEFDEEDMEESIDEQN